MTTTRRILSHQEDVTVTHYSFDGTLPENQVFALSHETGTISLLEATERGARLLAQQQFTSSELSVLLPLIASFPYHCPYEELFAHFYTVNPSEKRIAQAREHLEEAKAAGEWDSEMRCVRNMLSRARLKARHLGLDAVAILDTGYMLKIKTP